MQYNGEDHYRQTFEGHTLHPLAVLLFVRPSVCQHKQGWTRQISSIHIVASKKKILVTRQTIIMVKVSKILGKMSSILYRSIKQPVLIVLLVWSLKSQLAESAIIKRQIF